MAFRIAHISDTHLSAAKPYFAANFLEVVNQISSGGADLVLNSGDMSLDGSAQESDLIEARRLHDTLALPLRFIPGNHDIGESQDAPRSRGLPILSAATRRRYLRHFGADYWCLHVPGWRVLAINDFLLGSDLAAADEQIDFVRQVGSTAGQAELALFTHRPLFHLSPDEQEVSGRFVNPQPRAMLLAALGAAKPALIGSGHVHQFVSHDRWGSHHIWAPSTGFILPDASQPHYGLKQTGYVEHLLKPDGSHFSRLVKIGGLASPSLADFPDAYAQYAAPPGRRLGTQQQRLPHPDRAAVGDVVTEPIAGRGKDQDG
jgi:3',5'-cyclic-AMP phosphodiesterase